MSFLEKIIGKNIDKKPTSTFKKREQFFLENRNYYYWLFNKEGNVKLNKDGEIPVDVLVEKASSITWGVGGQHERDWADEVADKHLTEFERSVLISISTQNLKGEYRLYIFSLIKDRLENYNMFSGQFAPD